MSILNPIAGNVGGAIEHNHLPISWYRNRGWGMGTWASHHSHQFLPTVICMHLNILYTFCPTEWVHPQNLTPSYALFTVIIHGLIFENFLRILKNSYSYCTHSRLKVQGFLRTSSTSFLKPVAALILKNPWKVLRSHWPPYYHEVLWVNSFSTLFVKQISIWIKLKFQIRY